VRSLDNAEQILKPTAVRWPVPQTFQISDASREVLIAANPRAGARSRAAVVEELRRRLEDHGLSASVVSDADQLAELVDRGLASHRLRAVIAAGGDGTVGLVANRTPPGTPIGILPLGTENLLAKHLGLVGDPAQLARLIAGGTCAKFDAGQAGGRLFTLMAGCGFDADVVQRLHSQRRGHIQHLSYAKPILDAIRTYQYPELQVLYAPSGAEPEAPLSEKICARWVFVVNLPRYAGGLSFAPQASGTDGLLDVCTFKEGSLWNGLWYLSGVMLGQHHAMQGFQRIQTARLHIDSAEPAPYQLDGDPGGLLPIEMGVVPERLTLVVSPDWARRAGFEVSTRTAEDAPT
jgi:diacylglycerol kinase (ATP)